ncbi:YcaO-like family protein [Halocalculus aciditolerans]|uniref:Bacteriocin biosynthesis protein SagD n=1 Tax=Halocalculus aciditolerans TaxID=1383812 RepID=A0A830FJH8_9EURY|nr:YcaO-like family protein [Halocalculus aciditolerans]GGL53016.1 bacteriocin biosynthesis protein SagD [Halocalculus aciditolerans]
MPDSATVALVGDGPAVEAVRAAVSDVDAAVEACAPGAIGGFDAAVVAGVAGSDGFARANAAAVESATPWVAVEAGGLGGYALDGTAASVSVLAPEAGCFACLRARMEANDAPVADAPSTDRATLRLAGAHAGKAVVDGLSAGFDGGRVEELPQRERTFQRVPFCGVCGGGRDRALSLTAEDVSLEDAVGRAERAVDDRVGVVQVVGERESYPAPYYLARSGDTSGFSDAAAARQAAGVAADWNAAYMKAIGEALERYCAGVYRATEFDVAPAGHPDGVGFDAFVRPQDAGTPDHDEPIRWLPGLDLGDGSDVRLPADLVQFPPPSEAYAPAITTGLGLGSDSVDAVLSGLYESVERDATMLAWYSTFEPMGLDVADDEYAELAKRARSEELTVTALLVTQDVDVPVVAVAVHREEWPRFALGSAADLDANAAARGALCEALQNWMELRAMGPEQASGEEGAIGHYADFPRAVRSFVTPETTIPADAVGPDESLSGREELDAVLDRLADADLDAYTARLTTPDVEALGFEAVRVLTPATQPLFVDDPYFGERARTVPEELGYEPRFDRDFHPFP